MWRLNAPTALKRPESLGIPSETGAGCHETGSLDQVGLAEKLIRFIRIATCPSLRLVVVLECLPQFHSRVVPLLLNLVCRPAECLGGVAVAEAEDQTTE